MKRFGRLVILTTAEVVKLYDKGVREGKFHASGGYAHALKDTRARLAGTSAVMKRALDLLAKWRPFVEALETYPNQLVEIGFDAGLHFPQEGTDPDGTPCVRTVTYGELRKSCND
jgi:hypothetical protein